MRVVLGIDPGTKCGWALFEDGRLVASGTEKFTADRFKSGGLRFLGFRKMVAEILTSNAVEVVGFEQVSAHKGTHAAQVYGGFVAVLTSLCESRGVDYSGIPVATVKRAATGKGNANKAQMIAAALERFGVVPVDDNEADAIWIGATMVEQLRGAA